MSKVTSKYQVSIPKALAGKLGVRVGDELTWEATGGVLRARVAGAAQRGLSVSERLRLFDAATTRQVARQRAGRARAGRARGWRREDLYAR